MDSTIADIQKYAEKTVGRYKKEEKPAEVVVAADSTVTPEKPIEAKPAESTPAAETKVDTTPAKTEKQDLTTDQLIEALKKGGIEIGSLDELKEKLAPKETPKEKTEDEIEAEVIDYAVKNKGKKVEDFLAPKAMSKKAPAELVYEKFAGDLKEADPSLTDEEIRSQFNNAYFQYDLNAEELTPEQRKVLMAAKKVGDKKLAEDAKSIKDAIMKPINEATSEYKTETQKQKELQKIKTEFDKYKVPDTVNITLGDNETVPLNLDNDYKKELQDKVRHGYSEFKARNPNGNFDFNAYQDFIVRTDKFVDILNVHSTKVKDAAVLEALKPFKNAIESNATKNVTEAKKEFDEKAATKQALDVLKTLR